MKHHRISRAVLFAAALAVAAAHDASRSFAADSASPQVERIAPSAKLSAYITQRTAEFDQIPSDRKLALEELANFVADRKSAGEPARLNFICTHNSRRSQLAQIWAAVAAAHHDIDGVETYSGGTEATAFNPRAVAALQRAGFEIVQTDEPATASEPENPRYLVMVAAGGEPLICFSKRYDSLPVSTADFCAVMTCADADQNCPIIPGAAARISLPYVDPKLSDGTPEEVTTYDARAAQIAREMLYAFSRIN